MTLRDPRIREAKAILAADRKAVRKARPARVVPVAKEQRQPRKRDPGFLQFLRRQPCTFAGPDCDGRIDPAHIRMHRPGERPTGAGRKPDDDRCVPLCRRCHDEQHTGEARFWAARGRDPFAIAAELYAQFLDGKVEVRP